MRPRLLAIQDRPSHTSTAAPTVGQLAPATNVLALEFLVCFLALLLLELLPRCSKNFLASSASRFLIVAGDIRGSDEEQVQPGPMSQSSDEFVRSSGEKVARAADGLTADTTTIQTMLLQEQIAPTRGTTFPRGEVVQLDGLSVGDADDSDDLDDAFAGAAFKRLSNAASNADADLEFFL